MKPMVNWQSDPEMARIRLEFIYSIETRLQNFQKLRMQIISMEEPQFIWNEIEVLLHKLAGVAATFGFSILSTISEILEDLLSQKIKEIPLKDWNQYFDLLEIALKEAVANQSDSQALKEDSRYKALISVGATLLD